MALLTYEGLDGLTKTFPPPGVVTDNEYAGITPPLAAIRGAGAAAVPAETKLNATPMMNRINVPR
jgi:hypothetical protein